MISWYLTIEVRMVARLLVENSCGILFTEIQLQQ